MYVNEIYNDFQKGIGIVYRQLVTIIDVLSLNHDKILVCCLSARPFNITTLNKIIVVVVVIVTHIHSNNKVLVYLEKYPILDFSCLIR